MTSKRQHAAKASTGPQRSTATTSKAADTGSAAKAPAKERVDRKQPKGKREGG